MGYRTIMNCPYIAGYDKALDLYKKIVPIKNRSPEIKPLGARRDADLYSIDIDTCSKDVLIKLGRNVAIAFHPDNTLTLSTFWSGIDCNHLFARVLGINAYTENRLSVVEIGGVKHVYDGNIKLRNTDSATHNPDVKYTVINPKQVGDWKMNREKASEIRKRYSPFLTYVSTMCKLRGEALGHEFEEKEVTVSISFEEMETHFNKDSQSHGGRTKHDIREYAQAVYGGSQGDLHLQRVMALIGSDSHEDWHKVMCVIARTKHHYGVREYYHITPDELKRHCRQLMYRYHKNECIEWVLLPLGKVPEGKYISWMGKHNE